MLQKNIIIKNTIKTPISSQIAKRRLAAVLSETDWFEDEDGSFQACSPMASITHIGPLSLDLDRSNPWVWEIWTLPSQKYPDPKLVLEGTFPPLTKFEADMEIRSLIDSSGGDGDNIRVVFARCGRESFVDGLRIASGLDPIDWEIEEE